jgi:LysR family transcriptional regulator, regulator for bpeEF and oprC
MKNLSQFFHFSVVARHESFSKAARELGLAPSSVAKSVARLEEALGARLFHRTTRAVTLTEEGQTLYSKCEQLFAQIESLDLTSLGDADKPSGVLRIGAPIGYRSCCRFSLACASAFPHLSSISGFPMAV